MGSSFRESHGRGEKSGGNDGDSNHAWRAGAEPGIFVWGGQVATLIYLSRQPHTHT